MVDNFKAGMVDDFKVGMMDDFKVGKMDDFKVGRMCCSAAFFDECPPMVGVGSWAVDDTIVARFTVAVVDQGA